jgi:thiosulfate/3-mercaptopyruvate sulfurtransferase
VALTLIYAGVKNVAVLDGGFPKWVAEERETTTEPYEPSPGTYEGETDDALFVSIDYVGRHIRSDDILDARDADVYFGVTLEPFANKAGHIPNALSLPGPWIWKLHEDGTYTYKDPETLDAMVSGVLRDPWRHKCRHWYQKIIVYCGVGGYASSWWYVLTQVLGYEGVKFYDGAAQEWAIYCDMVPFQWE